MKLLRITCMLSLLPSLGQAYLHQSWPYQKLNDQADLIVIATPGPSKETGERSTLPGIKPELSVLKVETTFNCLVILKGEKTLKQIVLTHYRKAVPTHIDRGGPSLVSFDAKSKKQFILFLKRDGEDKFAPVAGQTDPADSIKEITSPQ